MMSDFSALCWMFGKRLYQSLGYPIGLIQIGQGGTAINSWSSTQALQACFPPEALPGKTTGASQH